MCVCVFVALLEGTPSVLLNRLVPSSALWLGKGSSGVEASGYS